jgi:hypothetical protein
MSTKDFIEDYFNIEHVRNLVAQADKPDAENHQKYIILCNYSHLHEYAVAKGLDLFDVLEVLEEALEVQVEVSSYSDLVVNLTEFETP